MIVSTVVCVNHRLPPCGRSKIESRKAERPKAANLFIEFYKLVTETSIAKQNPGVLGP
jgi:hypothetical protein